MRQPSTSRRHQNKHEAPTSQTQATTFRSRNNVGFKHGDDFFLRGELVIYEGGPATIPRVKVAGTPRVALPLFTFFAFAFLIPMPVCECVDLPEIRYLTFGIAGRRTDGIAGRRTDSIGYLQFHDDLLTFRSS